MHAKLWIGGCEIGSALWRPFSDVTGGQGGEAEVLFRPLAIPVISDIDGLNELIPSDSAIFNIAFRNLFMAF